MFGQEQADQSLQCLQKTNLIMVYSDGLKAG